MSPVYNVKNLLGDLSGWVAAFAEENKLSPTRRGRLLVALLLLVEVAALISEDDPSPALRKKLVAFFSSSMGRNDRTEEIFHDLLGVRFGVDADFKFSSDVMAN